jgi:hypothetical protein
MKDKPIKECNHPTCGEVCRRPKKPKKLYRIGRRTPLKKKPYKIKRRSDKRAEQEKEYSKGRIQFLIEHPVCEFNESCQRESTDVHHPEGRIGDLLTDFSKCKALCRGHHVWVELHPKEAKELGLSKSRLSKNE